jgi:hypothetical protein
MNVEERQQIIALFNAGGLNTVMDLSRLNYSDVIARFVRVYELIETNVRDSLTTKDTTC